jgi:hypothetical protein
MRIGTCIAALGIALMVTGSAMADDAAQPAPKAAGGGGHHQHYGAAGCGLGSLIIKSGGFVQIFSATTNGTSANQTFAITSGTSNCDDSGGGDDAQIFVKANRVALAKDISRGQGETIADLSAIAGCADAKAVGQKLQSRFTTIFPNASVSSEQVTDAILTTLKSDATLACSAIGG